jgi:hypothetical protein
MNAPDPKLIVALYLRGTSLNPDQATQLLNVQPTRRQIKGQKSRTSTGHEVVAPIGLWTLVIELDSVSLDEHLKQLLDRLPDPLPLSSIAGLEEAYIDSFIAIATDSDGDGSCDLSVSSAVLQRLGQLALPLRLTFTAGPD